MFPRISLSLLLGCAALSTLNAQPKTAPVIKLAPSTKPTIPTPIVKQQTKPAITVAPTQAVAAPAPKPLNYKKINNELEYAMIVDKPTSPKPKEGDLVKLHMTSVGNNRVIYSTRLANKNQAVEFSVNKPTFKADIINVILLMTPGDSLVCQVDASAIYKNTKNAMPDFIKNGDKLQYFIKMVSVKTKEQMQKEQQAKFAVQQAALNKKMQAQQAAAKKKQEKEQAILIPKEDAKLQEYFAKNGLTPTKTASGLYYVITEKGTGNLPIKGDTAVMNYTGTLLDGTKFDSNVDSAFNHVQPFEFPLGQGRVIKGWDEGVALLPKGSKATFFIPSRLGYGAGAQAKIPANSILLFDVELKDIKPQPIKN